MFFGSRNMLLCKRIRCNPHNRAIKTFNYTVKRVKSSGLLLHSDTQ